MNKNLKECLKTFVFWAAVTFVLGMAYQTSQGRTHFNRTPQSESIDDVFESILDDLGENWESSEQRIAREKTTDLELMKTFEAADKNIDTDWATHLNLDEEYL